MATQEEGHFDFVLAPSRYPDPVQVLYVILLEPQQVTSRERIQVLYVSRIAPLYKLFEFVSVGVDGRVS